MNETLTVKQLIDLLSKLPQDFVLGLLAFCEQCQGDCILYYYREILR